MTTTARPVLVRDVLEALFEPSALVELRAIKTGGGVVGRCFVTREAHDQVRAVARQYQDAELYWGVASRFTATNGKTDNCHQLSALFADLDYKQQPEPETRKVLAACPCPPSIVVASGGGLHAYYLLKEPIDVQAEGTLALQVLKRLVRYLGADPACADLARVLRVPHTINHKYTPARRVEVEAFDPARRYTLGDFDWLPSLPTPLSPASPPRPIIARAPIGSFSTQLDVLQAFRDRGWYFTDLGGGKHGVTCPWADAHTVESGVSESALFELDDAANPFGFQCQHAHCADRTIKDVYALFRGRETAPAGGVPAPGTTADLSFPPTSRWPDSPDTAAFRGLAGAYVRAVEPYSEADPTAILVQLLVAFGNAIGPGPYFSVEADRHSLNEFVIVVAPTAVGRKGLAWRRARAPIAFTDPDWAARRIQGGLSSGEGLLHAVRDASEKPRPKPRRPRSGDSEDCNVVVDPGVVDKRLLAVETEFASTLRVMNRDGNTLSALIRQAWDSGDLRVLTRNNPMTATGAHISIIGHITRDELRAELTRTDAANGFGNRFLWICAQRSKELPDGGLGDVSILGDLSAGFRTAHELAMQVHEMHRTDEARTLWHEAYHDLSAGRPGLLGAMLSRAEAHTMRLACLYALLDGSPLVDRDHLESALALWQYCEASAKFVFGDDLGNPVADTILRALRQTADGLTRTEISALFGRNASQASIEQALRLLAEQALASPTTAGDGPGRPPERWRALR